MNTETFLILSPLVILALLLYIFILLKNNNLKNNDLYDNSKKLDDLKVSIDIFKETQAGLKESQTNLKESVHDMYTLLTKGGSKHIGQFGEITLRKILENSGLKEGTNFLEEKLHGSEKPDYVIMLPEGRKIVIDSKVSTKDYAQYLKTNDSNLKEIHKKDHITSLKRHIKSLSSTEYRSLYGTDTLEIHQDAIQKGQNILVVDDLLATGGTAEATCKLISKLKGNILGFTVLIELKALKARKRLDSYNVHSLVKY